MDHPEIISSKGELLKLTKTKKYWICRACNGMYGETRYDRRNRVSCEHQHKTEESARKCARKLHRYKRRIWIPIEIIELIYSRQKTT